MSWLQSLQSAVVPLFTPDPTPVQPETRDTKAPKPRQSATRVSGGGGVSVSSTGTKSVRGNVKVRSGPSTSSATVKVDDKGHLTGRLGQSFELRLGEHTLVLGGSVGSDGELRSQVTFKSAPRR